MLKKLYCTERNYIISNLYLETYIKSHIGKEIRLQLYRTSEGTLEIFEASLLQQLFLFK